jgi:exopolysaccharide biosynthesis WecB/TagA/CpsF family protein
MVGGHPVDPLGRRDLVARFLTDRGGVDGQPTLVFDINGQGISMHARDARYRELVQAADVVHADGQVVVLASALKGDPRIPDRSATTDMIHDLAELSGEHAIRFFLLGGPEGLAERAAQALRARYPKLQVVGTQHGFFHAQDSPEICARISAARPDVLWVGLGKPREQAFCVANRAQLRVPWVVTCGGCFHFLTGDYRRAPRLMQRLGLEWLHRMATRPRRLFWRYLTTTPHALWLIATRSGRGPRG